MMFSRLVGMFRPVEPVVEVAEVEALNKRLHELHARMEGILA